MKYKIGDEFKYIGGASFFEKVIEYLSLNNLVITSYYNKTKKEYLTDVPIIFTKAKDYFVFDEADIDNYFINVNKINKLKKLLKGETK